MKVTFILTDGTEHVVEEGGYNFDNLRNELHNSEESLILVGYTNSEVGLTQTLRRLKDVREVVVCDELVVVPKEREEEEIPPV